MKTNERRAQEELHVLLAELQRHQAETSVLLARVSELVQEVGPGPTRLREAAPPPRTRGVQLSLLEYIERHKGDSHH